MSIIDLRSFHLAVGVTHKHHGMQLHGDLTGLLWLLGLAHMVLLPDSRIISWDI